MTSVDVSHCYRFGRFVLEPERRSLSAGDAPVALGARAFDILLLLVRHHDRVVTKDEILSEVWRGMVVEENNLAVHISALRRALGERPGGDRFIATISGMGYRFVASVVDAARGAPAESERPPVVRAVEEMASAPALPAPVARPDRRRLAMLAVAATLALAAVAGWFALDTRSGGFDAPRLSLAVLPFRSMGGAQDYLADAVTDDLTTDLSHIPRSVVIARASAGVFKDRTESATAIGQSLHVRYLLEGSLLAEGKTLHVNAQLVDAANGSQLWANVFDVGRDDLGQSLTEIVGRVSSALRFTLVQVEGSRSLRDHARNPDALDLYLRARSVLDGSMTFPALVSAQGLLERAISIAPDDPEALAELGIVLVRKSGEFDDPNLAADDTRAATVVARATKLAPQNPRAVTAAGLLAWGDRRYREAVSSFKLALSLDPDDPDVHTVLARCYLNLGDVNAALTELSEALRIDPIGPESAHRQHMMGIAYLMMGKPKDAITWFDRAGAAIGRLDDDETSLSWRNWRRIFLIAAWEMAGEHERATSLYTDFNHDWPNRTIFQLASYTTRAFSKIQGTKTCWSALHAAGMPLFAGEDVDFGVASSRLPKEGSEFDPTPMSIPGARMIRTADLVTLMSTKAKPLVLDFSSGAHVIPGAVSVPYLSSTGDLQTVLDENLPGWRQSLDTPVVTMSHGPFGWQSYNASLQLVSLGLRNVYWYRGGEAAWSSSGHETEDKRPL